ncbi:MAG: hypothetical protein HY055_01090 [Magnetospirillum sp.]|nr:hypothetical protein [Magnetospirillum sp.]
MSLDQRQCLPDRVRTMVGILSGDRADQSMQRLITDGCDCAARRACDLWHACDRIHQAFAPCNRTLA